MKTVAIIDDDVHISDMLREALEKAGYAVVRAWSGTEALMLLSERRPDIILLDLMLPGLSGEEVLKEIKDIPVIVLSARAGVDDKVRLLLGGAADYMTKPFEISELLARITVRLRRAESGALPEPLALGELTLDTVSQSAAVGGNSLKLTRTEFAILKLLMSNPGRVISRGALLDMISADTPDCTERSLKQHISNIRRKIQEAGGPDCIETVWGIGFVLK